MKEITELDRSEVLLYLGHRGSEIPESLHALIDECISETLSAMKPRMVMKRYHLNKPDSSLPSRERYEKGIVLSGSRITLTGESIAKHLIYCDEAFLISTSIGLGVERLIKRYMMTDPAKGVIMDSCGSVAVEAVTQAAEDEAGELAAADGLNITWRFGPGYGDLPITIQRDIIEELDATNRIGVAVNDDCLLSPTKSETAVIGIMKQEREKRGSSCDVCRFRESCNIKAHGAVCH